jgi:hypothetical protein
MSILFSGDFHNNARSELMIIEKDFLIKQYSQIWFDEITYHIILGDGGFLWSGKKERNARNYEALSMRPFPILCVYGNHDPALGRVDLTEADIGIGEKVVVVNKEKPFIAYLKRGKVYHIENKKILVLGGALSIDKGFRISGSSWWEQEYWSKQEKNDILTLLEKDNSFDYVLAHTGPNRINFKLFGQDVDNKKFTDKVAFLNEQIDQKIICKQWLCGHFHQNKYYFDKEKNRGYLYLYEDTALLRENVIITSQYIVK